MGGFVKSIKKYLSEGIGNFDKAAIVGLILLLASFSLGALTRNSIYITNEATFRFSYCDTYISWLCIPTRYVTLPLGALGSLVINLTSFLSSAVLFILGIILVRNRGNDKNKRAVKGRR